jgi:AraC-like DNA-binding protein
MLSELQTSFNTMLVSNPLIADAGIVFSEDVCLSRHRVFYYPETNTFTRDFIRCGDLSKRDWIDLLSEERPFVPAMLYRSPDYGSYEAITFVAHWSYSEHPAENLLFAALPLKNMLPLIVDTEVAAEGFIRITSNQGNVLCKAGNEGAENVHVITGQSSAGYFTFEVGVPDYLVKEKMPPVINLIFIFTAVVLVLTIFLVLFFTWQSTKPVQAFLDTIDSTRVIRGEYEHFREKLSLYPFKGLRQFFFGIGMSVSQADVKFENSLRVIDRETQLIRIRMADKIKEALEEANDTGACTILYESIAALPETEDSSVSALVADMLSGTMGELKKEFSEILAGVDVPVYAAGNQKVFFGQLLPDCFKKTAKVIREYREKGIIKTDKDILNFINEHLYDSRLYVSMISDHFDISPPSIQKLIKKVSGQTFQAYVENCRLSRACEILAEGKHAITETATLCGFSTTRTFSRAFKRVYGFSPSNVRPPVGS